MTTTASARIGSYLTPSFEHARVSDAMRPRVLACHPGDGLRDVARLMASEHVHAIVLLRDRVPASGVLAEHAWAVITDLDVLRVSDQVDDLTAGEAPTTEVLTVHPDDRLADAAKAMAEHDTSHAVVVSRSGLRPIGMLSTLDVAGVLSWGLG